MVSILVLILGVVFIFMFDGDTLPRSIVFLCGLAFAVPALILLLSTYFSDKEKRSAGYRSIQMVCGIGGLGLGASIMLMPDIFRPLLVYPFAALLVAGGLFQVLLLANRNRPVDYPGQLYIIPLVVVIAGVVMLCLTDLHEPQNERWVVLITGIASVLYGFNGIMLSAMGKSLPRRGEAKAAVEAPKDEKEPEKPAKEAEKPEKAEETKAEPEKKA